MKTLTYLLFLLPFLGFSQTPQWQWAKRGGSTYTGFSDQNEYRYNLEYDEILDIQTDNSSNVYFLGTTVLRNSSYDNIPIQTYGNNYQYVNTLLTKTDCNGNYLWHKTIGGFQTYVNRSSLQISSTEGIYVGGTFLNTCGGLGNTVESMFTPLHIDTDSIFVNDGTRFGDYSVNNKFIQLIKYNTEGELQWVRSPEDSLQSGTLDWNYSLGIALDAEENIHWAVYFHQGSFLNGRIQVPTNAGHYYVLKYDRLGNYVSHTKLAATGVTGNTKTVHFLYNAAHNQYVFSIMRFNDDAQKVFYPEVMGTSEGKYSLVMAFDANTGVNNWYHTNTSNGCPFHIGGLGQDTEGNIYVSGFTKRFGSREQSFNFFAGYGFDTPTATRNDDRYSFVVKLNAQGVLQWGSTSTTNTYFDNLYDIAFDGDKLLVAGALPNTIWGDQRLVRPAVNYNPDPAIVTFNKHTGQVLGIKGVEGQSSSSAAINAIKVITPNNYLVGGYYKSSIFHNEALVNPLYVIGQNHVASDYFLAKLGTERCTTASVSEERDFGLHVYPNPVENILYVSDENVSTYILYNVLGQEVASGKVENQQIEVSKHQAGIYFIKLTTNTGETQQVKIIKK